MNWVESLRKATTGWRDPDDRAGLPEAARAAFTAGHNACALALYQRLPGGTGNRVFSPLSVRMSLGMVWSGACGETAAQMAKALHFDLPAEQVHDGFSALHHRSARTRPTDRAAILANSLWAQAGAPLRTEFEERLERTFGGGANGVDFRQDAEGARRQINAWAGRKTNEEIRELMRPGSVSALTRLVLMNACKFVGTWKRPFPADETTDQPFHLGDGGEVRVPLMCLDSLVRVSRADDFTAVELPYDGDGMSMLVLLPTAMNGLPALEARLSTELLDRCLARMLELPAKVWLPRFQMRWAGDLAGALGELGMTDAFDSGRADLSGINGVRPPNDDALAISCVRHEARVETDEQGTRASAATAAGMWKCGPANFRADHPFLFAIRDASDGTIWFLGRVADPSRRDS